MPNAPAVTQRETVQALAAAAGTTVKVGTVPAAALKLLGLVSPMMRELQETSYQFERPWIADSTRTEQLFGLSATPLVDQARATIDWFRARPTP